MSQLTRQKIEKLNAHIQKLEQEKKALHENLKKSLIKILDDNFIFECDFETLAGGVLSVKTTLTENTEASKKMKERWKKEGESYFQKSKKVLSKETK